MIQYLSQTREHEQEHTRCRSCTTVWGSIVSKKITKHKMQADEATQGVRENKNKKTSRPERLLVPGFLCHLPPSRAAMIQNDCESQKSDY